MEIMQRILYIVMNALRLIANVTKPVSDDVLTFLYRLKFGKTKVLPPIENKILLLPAVTLAAKIRKKQVSCEEVMQAYVDRSKAVHPLINAAVDQRYDDAIKDARCVDLFLSSTHKSEKELEKDTPLLGIPFSCKESVGVKDMAQTFGVYSSRRRKAPQDSDVAVTYRKAGAIPYVVTNVPEYCMCLETANQIFGITLNPFDNTRSVGGSSGGEAALLTSAAGVIGIAEDMGGSIRIPAAFCGIYGHKPSAGLVSNKGQFSEEDGLDMYMCTGPMCRYVEDLTLLTKVCSDHSTSVPWDDEVDFHKVKFYYMEEIPSFLTTTDQDIKNTIRTAANHFEDKYGVIPIKITIDDMKYAYDIWDNKILDAGLPLFHETLYGKNGSNSFVELFKSFFGRSEHTLPSIYIAMIERRSQDKLHDKYIEAFKNIKQQFDKMFEQDAVLFLPTYLEPPPHYLMSIPKSSNPDYTCILNILGHPSTQIPAGLSKGLPIGLQAVSGLNKDHLTLAAAMELDKVFNGWTNPCEIQLSL